MVVMGMNPREMYGLDNTTVKNQVDAGNSNAQSHASSALSRLADGVEENQFIIAKCLIGMLSHSDVHEVQLAVHQGLCDLRDVERAQMRGPEAICVHPE